MNGHTRNSASEPQEKDDSFTCFGKSDSSITIAGHLLDTIKRIKQFVPSILDGHKLCDGLVNGFLLAGIASVDEEGIYEFTDGSRLRFSPTVQEVLPPNIDRDDEF